MLTRREFLKIAGLVALWPYGCVRSGARARGEWVNDVHSQLNPTHVEGIVWPDSSMAISDVIKRARRLGKSLSLAGGRHAMGGQQFGTETILLDLAHYDRILGFDRDNGIIEVESGVQWPAVIDYLTSEQAGRSDQWGIAQKQTGTDRLTIGGTLAANAHGRGLKMKPIISDVESITLIDADGDVKRCSRRRNRELFRLAVGGYGLFGVISKIRLRLVPRQKVERVVTMINADELVPAFEERIRDGFTYGDCQCSIDESSDDFLRRGVFSCYRPVDPETPIPEGQKSLAPSDWRELIHLAHSDRGKAFDRYSEYYLSTSGQVYWSDLHQLSTYMDDYHHILDQRLDATFPASEIITELYVPRHRLEDFLAEARDDFRNNQVNVVYGTIRLIEKDDESFLAWAREPYACVIFNLHTRHTDSGVKHSADAFRRLIDMAISRGGSYFLTYHRFATRAQVEACYPQFVDFLRLKLAYDPEERFQSDWYRHYRGMFSDSLL